MRTNPLKSCSGFTFIAALMIVILMGILLGAVGQSWQMVMKREREAELLFRGGQILDAIKGWRNPRPIAGQPNPPARPLRELKDLLEDPNSLQKRRYLRRLYKDPITNKDFDIIKGDPTVGVIGVASSSTEKPLKIDFRNMSGVYKTFDKKDKYSDWKFVPTDLQSRIPGRTTVAPLPGQSPLPGGMQ